MFEALFDQPGPGPGHAQDDDAAAHPPPPPAAPVARARRGGVAAHSELSKLRIKLSFARKSIERKDQSLNKLAKSNFTSFSQHVASVTFGAAAPDDRKVLMLKDGGNCIIGSSKAGERSYDRTMTRMYGCVSAVHAQAAGAADFL